MIRYYPGQGAMARWTALYPAGVVGVTAISGPITDECGFAFGYNGTSFGILHRNLGLREIQTLTVTVGAGGSETATVTLNSITKSVPLRGSSGRLSQTSTAPVQPSQASQPSSSRS